MTHKREQRKKCGSGGGGVLSGVVSALKTALPSIVLYEALKMQGRRAAGKGRRSIHKRRRGRGSGSRKRSRKSRKGRGSRKRGSRRRR